MVDPLRDFAQLQLPFVDHIPWRYAVIRPLVLFADDTAAHRAEETHLHPDTVRRLTRRFQQHGMRGLFPDQTALVTPSRGRHVRAEVVAEIHRLKALYDRCGYRELARIIHYKDDSPYVGKPDRPKAPGPHPYQATAPHEYWFIDGRPMDFAIDGVKWWSLIVLDGYSRTRLAGAVAPPAASWVALMVLYTACLRDGSPKTIISDSGGAYISEAFAAACDRLEIHHEPIVSKHGDSDKNLMETHFNVQRRL